MSLETELKNLTKQIKDLTESLKGSVVYSSKSPQQLTRLPIDETPAPAAPAPAPAAPAPAAPAPAAPAAPVPAVMTPEELNAALVEEFTRLGDRAPIDQAMQELGVSSVNDLNPDQYQVLLDKVKAI